VGHNCILRRIFRSCEKSRFRGKIALQVIDSWCVNLGERTLSAASFIPPWPIRRIATFSYALGEPELNRKEREELERRSLPEVGRTEREYQAASAQHRLLRIRFPDYRDNDDESQFIHAAEGTGCGLEVHTGSLIVVVDDQEAAFIHPEANRSRHAIELACFDLERISKLYPEPLFQEILGRTSQAFSEACTLSQFANGLITA